MHIATPWLRRSGRRRARRLLGVVAAAALLAAPALTAVPAASAAPAATTAVTTAATAAADGDGARTVLGLDREWKFVRGDWKGFAEDGPEKVSYDDSGWSNVGLPHSFSTPYNQETTWYTGTGWYRRHLDAPADWQGKEVRIEFEGAFQVTEVWVNGTKVGTHSGGYTGFTFDIGPELKTGDNVIAVRVNNEWNGAIAPRAGEHTFSGGIYRDVNLTVTDPVNIPWSGTALSTSLLTPVRQTSDVRMAVDASTEVQNQGDASADATVVTTVADADGKVVATMSSDTTVAAGKTATVTQQSDALQDPHLWTPDDPYLYAVTSQVVRDGKVVDETTDQLGFRWTEWTKDQGFFLNGVHTYLNGVDVHQDQAGWGDAVTDSAIDRDVEMVKGAGFNFIRGSHYPHDPEFYEEADRLGVMVLAEVPFWGIGGQSTSDDGSAHSWLTASAYPVKASDQAGFEASVKQQLEELIRTERNRASIIGWSLSNEPFFSADSVKTKAIALLQDEVGWAHAADPTRGAGVGGGQRWDLQDVVKDQDFIGLNGDGADFYLTKTDGTVGYQKNSDGSIVTPPVATIVNEYGSQIQSRPGSWRPYFGEIQATSSDVTQAFEPTWRSGQAAWAGFDHGSDVAGMGDMGIVDYHRLPKRTWYWYRDTYNPGAPSYLGISDPGDGKEPTWPQKGTATSLSLEPGEGSSTTITDDGTQDAQLVVRAMAGGKQVSDKLPVTLTVVSGPGQFPTHATKTIDTDTGLDMTDGIGATTFRSYYPGTTVIKASSPGLPDATITITTKASTTADGTVTTEPAMTIPVAGGVTTLPDPEVLKANLATSRPVSASSAASGHAASAANDGDAKTSWQAADDSAGQWWDLDPEGGKHPYELRLTFATPGVYGYKIQGEKDDGTFVDLVDRSGNTAKLTEVRERLDGTAYRTLRVVFTSVPDGVPANLAEVTLLGTQNDQYATTGSYVSDLTWKSAVSGWKTVQKDTSIEGTPLTIGGTTYAKGLGTHSVQGSSDAVVTYDLGGSYSRFVSDVGVDDEVAATCGSNKVSFQVYGDGDLLADSGTVSASSAAKTIDVSIVGVDELELVVTDPDGSNSCDHADWGGARVLGVLADPTVDGSAVSAVTSTLGAPAAGKPVTAQASLTATAATTDPVAAIVAVFSGSTLVAAQKAVTSSALAEGDTAVLLPQVTVPADAGDDLRTEVVVVSTGSDRTVDATTASDADTRAAVTAVLGSDQPAVTTSTSLALSANGQTYGTAHPVTATATVAAASGDAAPSGKVEFAVGGADPFTTVALEAGADGKATAAATLPADVAAGTATVTATFVPDDEAAFTGSHGDAPLTVSRAASTVAQTVTTAKLSGSWTAQVDVTVGSGSALPACGTVRISQGQTVLASIELTCTHVTEEQDIRLLVSGRKTTLTTTFTPTDPKSVAPATVTTTAK